MEFLKVLSRDDVVAWIATVRSLGSEVVPLVEAYGRVLATPIYAREDVPHFHRATMDGYAVRARDTFGASESTPSLLTVVGAVEMGKKPPCTIRRDEAVSIPTGGVLPHGADAVVMIEHTEKIDATTIEVYRPVAPGDHVLTVGEDIPAESLLFPEGRLITPQDMGTLAAVGVHSLAVYRRPRVAIVSTGDEIVSFDTPSPLPLGVVRDINTVLISGLCEEIGVVVGERVLIRDDITRLTAVCRELARDHDVVLLSGGSSVGVRDFTLDALQSLPQAHLIFHGLAIKPGKPTMACTSEHTYFWGLPGQPASAMVAMIAVVCPFLMKLQGRTPRFPYAKATCEALLATKIPSVHGREDYVPVRFIEGSPTPSVEPLFGKSGAISPLSQASGFVVIPEHVEGLEQDSSVTVYLF